MTQAVSKHLLKCHLARHWLPSSFWLLLRSQAWPLTSLCQKRWTSLWDQHRIVLFILSCKLLLHHCTAYVSPLQLGPLFVHFLPKSTYNFEITLQLFYNITSLFVVFCLDLDIYVRFNHYIYISCHLADPFIQKVMQVSCKASKTAKSGTRHSKPTSMIGNFLWAVSVRLGRKKVLFFFC